MSDDNLADGGLGPPPSLGVGRIYRRKHTLRAICRSSILVMLMGGCALYHHFERSSSGLAAPPHRSTSDVGVGAIHNLRNGAIDSRHEDSIIHSRLLEAEDGPGEGDKGNATSSRQAHAEDCPEPGKADPEWHAALYSIGTLYMFLALAIVCDEFFVPALEEISSERHLNLSMDVAGATLMAMGGSAPELFTSFVGTFKQSDIGIGTIVGSAVFNVLFVLGTCALLSKEVLTLSWWPLIRDSSYYALGLLALSVLAGVVSQGQIYWWKALILLVMYLGYVLVMHYNRKLYKRLTGMELESPEDGDSDGGDTVPEEEDEAAAAQSGEKGGADTPLLYDDGLESSSDREPSALVQEAFPNDGPTSTDTGFHWPGRFHTGILQLLLHPEAWKEKGGVEIVVKINDDVDRAFEQIDANGDGIISKEELGKLLKNLGHEISQEELKVIFLGLDVDGNGKIRKEEFSNWYMTSEEHVLSTAKPIFDTFDENDSGKIEPDKVKELVKTLEPRVADSDVDDAIKSMHMLGQTEEITYEEFADWHVHSIAYFRRESLFEGEATEESQGVYVWPPPMGKGCFALLKYLLVLPLLAVLTLTIPDVRRPGYAKWCYVSFVLSIAWIGLFSNFMVDWVEIVGNTIGIPPVVMGYTVLAAGTSIPDMLSSVIVARMGKGDMAVANSVGSNIFDILVGLPLPWLVFTLWPGTPDVVVIQSKGIWQSILVLIGILVARIAVIYFQGWKMTHAAGGLMFLLYFAFLVQAILTEYFQNPCFG